jgi:energy-coupling factor transport system ATP-binding protein
MIKLEEVSFCYPGTFCPAVDSANLTIERGEFIAVMGSNASGKSTLARLLNGLLKPDQGRLTVNGLDTRDHRLLPAIRRQVGLLFPDPDNQIISNLVEEDVAFGPENQELTTDQIRYRVDTALKQVSMEDYAKYPPYLLSGGQKQRVGIAGIMAMRPDYMILDEPTAMLDPQGRRQVIDTLLKLHREENLSLVWMTHRLEEACLADRIIILERGKIIRQGTPQQIIALGAKLKDYGIEPLPITLLIEELKREGVNLKRDIDYPQMLVNALCQLY